MRKDRELDWRTKARLKRIAKHFDKIDDIYREMALSTRDKIGEFHGDKFTLPHCIGWGKQACKEILETGLPKEEE